MKISKMPTGVSKFPIENDDQPQMRPNSQFTKHQEDSSNKVLDYGNETTKMKRLEDRSEELSGLNGLTDLTDVNILKMLDSGFLFPPGVEGGDDEDASIDEEIEELGRIAYGNTRDQQPENGNVYEYDFNRGLANERISLEKLRQFSQEESDSKTHEETKTSSPTSYSYAF
jgi:hypothetical protein